MIWVINSHPGDGRLPHPISLLPLHNKGSTDSAEQSLYLPLPSCRWSALCNVFSSWPSLYSDIEGLLSFLRNFMISSRASVPDDPSLWKLRVGPLGNRKSLERPEGLSSSWLALLVRGFTAGSYQAFSPTRLLFFPYEGFFGLGPLPALYRSSQYLAITIIQLQ